MVRGAERREAPPRIYREGRYWKIDLRGYGSGRFAMRDPRHPRWPDGGRRTEDEEVAERWKWAYLDWIREGVALRQLGRKQRQQRTVEETRADYLKHRSRTVAKNTYGCDRTGTGHLIDFFGKNANPEDFVSRGDGLELQRLFDSLADAGYSPSTLGKYLGSIRGYFRWLGLDPCGGVELPQDDEIDEAETWAAEEIAALKDAAGYVDRAQSEKGWPSARLMLEALLATGCRQQELFALDRSHFDPTNRTVEIVRQMDRDSRRFRRLKGKVRRTAVVLPGLWERFGEGEGLLLGRPDGTPLGYRSQCNLLQRVLDAARLNGPGVGFHRGRHTYARLFLELGGRIDELQRSLGHSSIRTTEALYVHFSGERAASFAVQRIYGKGRGLRLA